MLTADRLDETTLRARLARFEVQAMPLAGRQAAAVALVLCDEGPGAGLAGLPRPEGWSTAPALLLTRRAQHLSRHAGQWALPGGRIDEGETPEVAALRELHEELGLALPPAAVIGRLDDYGTRSGYVITPVLVWGGRAEPLQPDAREVASVHRLPVAELLRADAPLLDPAPSGAAGDPPALRMPVGTRWIAAPTAAFLYQLREWLWLGRPTRVAHFDQPRFAWR